MSTATHPLRIPANGDGILTYRLIPLHNMRAAGAPVTGYAINMTGITRTSCGPETRIARYDTVTEARHALDGINPAHIDDECAA